MPARIIILTSPAHDIVTEYLHSWSEKIHSDIPNLPNNTLIYKLIGEKVTREMLTGLVQEKDPHLILFNGHGSSKKIFGFEMNVLIALDDNEVLLRDRIVHSLV